MARPALMASLEWLELGDSDTGHGSTLTNQTMQLFVAAAPQLRVLMLDACTRLDDATLVRAFECCPRLERVRLNGHDSAEGSVHGRALMQLKDRSELAPALKEVTLIDQAIKSADAKAVTAARRGLAVRTGNSIGPGIADQMIAAFTGGESMTTYFNGKVVNVDQFHSVFEPYGPVEWGDYMF